MILGCISFFHFSTSRFVFNKIHDRTCSQDNINVIDWVEAHVKVFEKVQQVRVYNIGNGARWVLQFAHEQCSAYITI